MPIVGFTGELAAQLRAALFAAYPTVASFTDLLIRVNQSYEKLSVVGSNYYQNILAIIQTAAADDWLPRLLAAALADVPGDPELLRLQKELSTLTPPPGQDYFDMCRLSGSHIMINRLELRKALREISRPLGKRILVIKGEKKTGKSHSLQLITYLKDVRRNFDMRFIDLERLYQESGTSKPLEPVPLAEKLSRLFKTRFALNESPTDAQWANWVLRFCNDFEDYALQDGRDLWIVIDAFNSVPLTQATFDIIKQIALRINETLTNLRLVLIGYNETLPGPALPHVEEESIEPIGPQHLLDFFNNAYQQMQIPLDAGRLEDTVQRVLEQVDPTQPDFLYRLGLLANQELMKASDPGETNV